MQREGWVSAQANKGKFKDRYMVLEETALVSYAKPNKLEKKGEINLYETTNVEIAFSAVKKPNAFVITTQKSTFVIAANSGQERDAWVREINARLKLVRGKDGGFDPFRPTPKSVLKPSNEPELLPLGPTQNKLPKKGAILNTTPDLRQHRAYYWTAEDVNLWMHQLALRYNYYDLLIEDGVDGETLIDELKTEEDWLELGLTLPMDIKTILAGREKLLKTV